MNPMQTTTTRPIPLLSDDRQQIAAVSRSLWHDAMLLGKPRITCMVLITVALGFLLAPGGTGEWRLLVHALFGVGFVAAASGILNQAWERDTDALMRRTRSRPLPTGRISPQAGYSIGVLFGIVGILWLILAVNVLTALLTLLTLAGYALLYTPMKRISAWNTLAGAIPGAMPPLLGYAAASNALPLESWFLFGILFLWQFPHFFAIAWMHKDDYAQAGLVMISTIDRSQGKLTGLAMLMTSWLLLAFSLLPGLIGWAGTWYLSGALVLGSYFCFASIRFLMSPSRQTARQALWASLVYLPPIFVLFILDGPRQHLLG
jgi:protoheme IX farnesyltransferase